MKKISVVLLIGITLMFSMSLYAQKGKKIKLENEVDSLSYAIGITFGSSLKSQQIPELSIDKITRAIEDIIVSNDPMLSTKESQDIIRNYLTQLQEKQKLENLIKANEFLEDNKKNSDVIVLESGLQYKVIKEGAGQSPISANRVKTHYKGTLLDGTVFDSSYDRGEPISFGVGQVIRGWQEALQLMKPGAKWVLYIHPDLGYGERATGSIPPNSLLIFEIELISVE